MKYHDSIKQAEQKSTLTIKQLNLWHLPASPINYSVCYEYIIGKTPELNRQIKQQLSLGKKLDEYFIQELYKQYILGQSNFREEIITDIDDLVDNLATNNQQSMHSADTLLRKLDHNIIDLKSNNQKAITNAVQQIEHASKSFRQKQQQLAKQLLLSKKQSQTLKSELAEIKKEVYLDPLTGLYNRKALNKNLEQWTLEDPNKQIAAIVVNVDKLSAVSDKFGGLISDVLLSKIANKIGTYVGDSGLPVRSGHDEFLILLPEIERGIASEIAEKIRQGVEKLRFVSSKSGVRLPHMTISLGVNDFNLSQNVESVINYTRNLVTDMQRHTANKITVAT
ncbi:GGDEF domain-containing protein [Thalassotalea sediminis]|uniref:GGDEF domain-containing protein n=1 Tax=Thalassotalea sediminis TaxID=1759089 RepID=UPI002572396B|nr:diguanylate cyclase [Thalassotalea sediminis]